MGIEKHPGLLVEVEVNLLRLHDPVRRRQSCTAGGVCLAGPPVETHGVGPKDGIPPANHHIPLRRDRILLLLVRDRVRVDRDLFPATQSLELGRLRSHSSCRDEDSDESEGGHFPASMPPHHGRKDPLGSGEVSTSARQSGYTAPTRKREPVTRTTSPDPA